MPSNTWPHTVSSIQLSDALEALGLSSLERLGGDEITEVAIDLVANTVTVWYMNGQRQYSHRMWIGATADPQRRAGQLAAQR